MEDLRDTYNVFFLLFTNWGYSENTIIDMVTVFYFSWPLIFVQLLQLIYQDLDIIRKWPIIFKFSFYLILLFLLATNGAQGGSEFIYFQF